MPLGFAAVYAVMNKAGGRPHANRTLVQLDVVGLKPIEEKMVLDAGALQSEIATEGRVADDILFDFDKVDIKPDSKQQFQEIAAFLKYYPELKVLIVGHTGAKGALDYNRDLSLRRAKAVVAALTSDYDIEVGRRTATNRTEAGRAKTGTRDHGYMPGGNENGFGGNQRCCLTRAAYTGRRRYRLCGHP